MAHPIDHAKTTASILGGVYQDWLPLHCWLDASKIAVADYTHRMMRHHTYGVERAVELFTSDTLFEHEVRAAAQQHIMEDCGGRVPEYEDWLDCLPKTYRIGKYSIKLLCKDSARWYGGAPEDYARIHEWFNAMPDIRLTAFGIFEAEEVFGVEYLPGVPTRYIGEHHTKSIRGCIPSLGKVTTKLCREAWMANNTIVCR